jgi:SdpI/YfhL protein family
METGNLIVFILCLVAAVFFVAMGIPCSQGWVPPNRLYGFRTTKTLHDPDVWYPTNRVAGYWGIATGILGAVVSVSTYLAGLGLPAAACVNLVPFEVGIIGTLTHGFLVIRRVSSSKQNAGTA